MFPISSVCVAQLLIYILHRVASLSPCLFDKPMLFTVYRLNPKFLQQKSPQTRKECEMTFVNSSIELIVHALVNFCEFNS